MADSIVTKPIVCLTLELTLEEARILQAMMQNQTSPDEPQEASALRSRIFELLYKVT